VPIQVTVPLATLQGLAEAPGELAGWGLLDADACRELAADGAWRRWVTDPISGALLDVGAREYVPSAALARFVRGRDRTCRWPACNMPAMRCDLDHRVPFDHEAAERGEAQPGPTVRANLSPLCRRHHRIKTLGLWQLTGDAAEVSRWTSPCGLGYERHPEPLLVPDLVIDDLDPAVASKVFGAQRTRAKPATDRQSMADQKPAADEYSMVAHGPVEAATKVERRDHRERQHELAAGPR
jgi:hypothetical protein